MFWGRKINRGCAAGGGNRLKYGRDGAGFVQKDLLVIQWDILLLDIQPQVKGLVS